MFDSVINRYDDVGPSYPKRFYVGVGGGLSRVAPDASASTQYSLEDSMSTAVTLMAGMDFSERLSFELNATDLGSATLAPPEEVNYKSAGLSAIYYAIGDYDSLASREGFAGFVRGGVNMMSHDSAILLDSEDNVQIMAGLGADYMMDNGFTVRAEVLAHDTDAQSAQLGLIYRFGESGSSYDRSASNRPPSQQRVPQSAPQSQVPRQPQVQPQIRPNPQPVPQVAPTTSQPLNPAPLPQVFQRPQAPAAQPSNVTGTSLLASGVLRGVEFAPRSTQMSASSGRILDGLAQQLKASPGTRVELQAHTDSTLGKDNAMKLSRARVLRIGKYLIARGVSASQLGARAFGANRSIVADPRSVVNNRIELLVSP